MQRKDKSKGNLQQRVVLSLVSMFMLIALALGVSAIDCGFSSPIANGYLTTNSLINTSYSNAGLTEASITMYINASSPSTANSSVATFVTSAVNETKATNMPVNIINMTMKNHPKLVLEPSNDYTFRCACENSTARVNCNSTVTGIIVDMQNVPPVPTGMTPSGEQSTSSTAFSATVAGANTTQCFLIFDGTSPGFSSYGMTHSGNTCTLTLVDMPLTTYSYKIQASDGTNTSTSALTSLEMIDATGNAGRRAVVIAGASGVSPTKPAVAKALGIQSDASAERGGSNFDLPKEVTQPELIKTGVGLGTGAVLGLIIGTITVPGVGTVAGPFIGGAVGALLGILA